MASPLAFRNDRVHRVAGNDSDLISDAGRRAGATFCSAWTSLPSRSMFRMPNATLTYWVCGGQGDVCEVSTCCIAPCSARDIASSVAYPLRRKRREIVNPIVAIPRIELRTDKPKSPINCFVLIQVTAICNRCPSKPKCWVDCSFKYARASRSAVGSHPWYFDSSRSPRGLEIFQVVA